MEEVSKRLAMAFEVVAANKGAPGPDGQRIEQVRQALPALLPELSQQLLQGQYRPGEIRRVWIPKAGGGQRPLGIPDVVDRMVQEAVRQVLEPLYEPHFHPNSHGFRPARSCHTAVRQAQQYLEDGCDWVVDLDLENFFGRVHHQRLMARLAQRVSDPRLLQLIGRMLKARVVLPDGVCTSTDEGVPQGGPLSPLLSNIVLDELDGEMQRRGYRFVRYADDANIYVRSERAGQRVMASVTRFIERRLRLKVNSAKSAVARPQERHFLGFTVWRAAHDGEVRVGLSERTKARLDSQIRALTPRNAPGPLKRILGRINAYTTGWMAFFGICTAQIQADLRARDAHIRRRLRAGVLRLCKRKRTIAHRLIQLGVGAKTAWRHVYQGRRGIWALSDCAAVNKALRNTFWQAQGLRSLQQQYQAHHQRMVAPVPTQQQLALG